MKFYHGGSGGGGGGDGAVPAFYGGYDIVNRGADIGEMSCLCTQKGRKSAHSTAR